MKKFPFKKIDAFATGKAAGNPAGYIRLESPADITDSEMQRLAKELKGFVNEVAFVHFANPSHPVFRYFSSEREVEFCGHATIAVLSDLVQNEASLTALPSFTISTNKGSLAVRNQNGVFIEAPAPLFKATSVTLEAAAEALRIPAADLGAPALVNAGLDTLLIPVRSLDAVLSLHPDEAALKRFCTENGVDIVEVYTPETVNPACRYRVRVFAPTFGYLEDPATGSGNSALGWLLRKTGNFQNETLEVEQNGDRENYNTVRLIFEKEGEKDSLFFGGRAIVRIDGYYLLT